MVEVTKETKEEFDPKATRAAVMEGRVHKRKLIAQCEQLKVCRRLVLLDSDSFNHPTFKRRSELIDELIRLNDGAVADVSAEVKTLRDKAIASLENEARANLEQIHKEMIDAINVNKGMIWVRSFVEGSPLSQYVYHLVKATYVKKEKKGVSVSFNFQNQTLSATSPQLKFKVDADYHVDLHVSEKFEHELCPCDRPRRVSEYDPGCTNFHSKQTRTIDGLGGTPVTIIYTLLPKCTPRCSALLPFLSEIIHLLPLVVIISEYNGPASSRWLECTGTERKWSLLDYANLSGRYGRKGCKSQKRTRREGESS